MVLSSYVFVNLNYDVKLIRVYDGRSNRTVYTYVLIYIIFCINFRICYSYSIITKKSVKFFKITLELLISQSKNWLLFCLKISSLRWTYVLMCGLLTPWRKRNVLNIMITFNVLIYFWLLTGSNNLSNLIFGDCQNGWPFERKCNWWLIKIVIILINQWFFTVWNLFSLSSARHTTSQRLRYVRCKNTIFLRRNIYLILFDSRYEFICFINIAAQRKFDRSRLLHEW